MLVLRRNTVGVVAYGHLLFAGHRPYTLCGGFMGRGNVAVIWENHPRGRCIVYAPGAGPVVDFLDAHKWMPRWQRWPHVAEIDQAVQLSHIRESPVVDVAVN